MPGASDRVVCLKVILDFIIVLAVGLPILILHLRGVPFRRGFFCDDDSIRYPYKDSTVSNIALYLVGTFVPVISICGNEVYEELNNKHQTRGQKSHLLFGRTFPSLLWRLYKRLGIFLFGACVSQLTTDIAKYSIGRLRPHFIAVCKPTVDCAAMKQQHLYIQDYSCQGSDADQIREARLSFPSGHSSFSAYTMVYLVLYLQACMHVKANKLLRPFLQFAAIMMAWYTALSRISDYKHHWSDVLFGFCLGAFVAVIVVYTLSDLFLTRGKHGSSSETQDGLGIAANANYNAIDLEQQ